MPAATRLSDANSGHDACPPATLASGSSNVYINGKPAGRVGDAYAPHGCKDHPSHVGNISSGAPHVFINDKPAARVGDSVSCGSTVAEGSDNVIVGDGGGMETASNNGFSAVSSSLLSVIEYKQRMNNQLLSNPDISGSQMLECIERNTEYEKNKLALLLAEISDAIANRDFSEGSADKQGFLYLSAQFRRWFAGDAASADIKEEPYLIDLDWARKYELTENAYQDLVINALSEAGQKLLLKRLKQTNLLPDAVGEDVAFDFTKYNPGLTVDGEKPVNQYDFMEKLYINSRNVGRNFDELAKNGLMAGLGSFELRALPKGTVSKNKDGTYYVSVTGLAVYLQDTFDFTDSKYYGYWSYLEKNFFISCPLP